MSHWFYITPDEYAQAAKNGVSAVVLEARVRSLAWTKQRAISEPPQRKRRLSKDWLEVALRNGICYSTFKYRCNQLGWSVEMAATKPLQDKRKQAKAAYEASRKYPKAYLDMARQNGINEETFRRRVRTGWPMERAATRATMTFSECGLLTKEKRIWRSSLLGKRSGLPARHLRQV